MQKTRFSEEQMVKRLIQDAELLASERLGETLPVNR